MIYGHISWRGVIFICKDTREYNDDGTEKALLSSSYYAGSIERFFFGG